MNNDDNIDEPIPYAIVDEPKSEADKRQRVINAAIAWHSARSWASQSAVDQGLRDAVEELVKG